MSERLGQLSARHPPARRSMMSPVTAYSRRRNMQTRPAVVRRARRAAQSSACLRAAGSRAAAVGPTSISALGQGRRPRGIRASREGMPSGAVASALISLATCSASTGPLHVRHAAVPARPLTPSRSRPLLSTNAAPAASASSATGTRLLWADKLSRANDGKIFQFKGVSTQLLSGQRLGLVGPNGCGECHASMPRASARDHRCLL